MEYIFVFTHHLRSDSGFIPLVLRVGKVIPLYFIVIYLMLCEYILIHPPYS